MQFSYRSQSTWPPLAWVATGDLACVGSHGGTATVFHGTGVETSGSWFGEIVWDSGYGDANFDRSDLVYGSGARIRDSHVCFVSASHSMDRLIWCVDGQRFWVGNSLPAVLAVSKTDIDPGYPFYPRDFRSMTRGLSAYRRSLANASKSVQLLYHDNLKWDSNGLTIKPKPVIDRDLSTYGAYREFLIDGIKRCVTNAGDPARVSGFEPLGTISTGFDSPTVTALAIPAGLKESLTVTSARGGPADDGSRLGTQLGVAVERIERDAYRQIELAEVPFLAADAKGEDVYFRAAENALRGRLFLTGYAAGAWAVKKGPLTELNRADQSGLSHTEYRLDAGYIHMPVPTMGLRSGGGIDQVNRSDEMKAWRTGKDYDKPFCRRLLNEHGIDDSQFGVQKKAASVLVFDRNAFLCEASATSFERYMERLRSLHRWRILTHQTAGKLRSASAVAAIAVAKRLPGSLMERIRHSVRLNECADFDHRFDYLFGWAIELMKDRYRIVSDSNKR